MLVQKSSPIWMAFVEHESIPFQVKSLKKEDRKNYQKLDPEIKSVESSHVENI